MQPVEISVVVPVYNAAAFLRETLDALEAQTFPAYEVILVDDGSTDGSGQLMDLYCAEHGKFRVLHVPNGGEYNARLIGARAARGRYVAFCDSDDLPLPGMLQKLYDRAEATGADVTVCGFIREEMGTGRIQSREMLNFEPRAYGFPELWDVLPVVNTALWNKLFRAELLQHTVPLAQPPRVAPDMIIWCSLVPFLRRVAFVPEPLYRYRVRPDSVIAQVRAEDVALARRNMEQVRDYVLAHSDDPAIGPFLDTLAFIHFGLALVIRQQDRRGAVPSARAWLAAQFPGYVRAGHSLPWNLRHRCLQLKVLLGRWLFQARLMGPFLLLYDLVTRKLKKEIKW